MIEGNTCDTIPSPESADRWRKRALAAEAERDALLEWKRQGMEVLGDLDLQAVGRTIGLRLGKSVARAVLPALAERQAFVQLVYNSTSTDVPTEALLRCEAARILGVEP